MVPSERSDDVVRDRDLAPLADPLPQSTEPTPLADPLPQATEPVPQRRVTWQQVLGLVVAAAALMLAIAGVVGLLAGVPARVAHGDAMDDVLAFVAQGVALVVGSIVVGLGALWLLVRGERRWMRSQAAPSGDERVQSA